MKLVNPIILVLGILVSWTLLILEMLMVISTTTFGVAFLGFIFGYCLFTVVLNLKEVL